MALSRQFVFLIVLLLVLLLTVAHIFARERLDRPTEILGGAKKTSMYKMLPGGRPPHTHLVPLDEKGTGVSTTKAGHRHKVVRFDVEPSGKPRHIHDITRYIIPAS